MKQCLNPPTLPAPGGAYSQVVVAGPLVFLAGMVPRNAARELPGDDIRSQTRQTLDNMRDALASVGASLSDVCTVTAHLADLARDFEGYNEVYREYFPADPPARATVESGIGDILVEIQAIAYVGD